VLSVKVRGGIQRFLVARGNHSHTHTRTGSAGVGNNKETRVRGAGKAKRCLHERRRMQEEIACSRLARILERVLGVACVRACERSLMDRGCVERATTEKGFFWSWAAV
jgi:hypothetical protein